MPGIPSISAAAATLTVGARQQRGLDRRSARLRARRLSNLDVHATRSCRLSSPKAAALTPFLTWAITTGQTFGPKLNFAPLPAMVVTADKATIAKIK